MCCYSLMEISKNQFYCADDSPIPIFRQNVSTQLFFYAYGLIQSPQVACFLLLFAALSPLLWAHLSCHSRIAFEPLPQHLRHSRSPRRLLLFFVVQQVSVSFRASGFSIRSGERLPRQSGHSFQPAGRPSRAAGLSVRLGQKIRVALLASSLVACSSWHLDFTCHPISGMTDGMIFLGQFMEMPIIIRSNAWLQINPLR